jgi:O-antigen ligase
MATATTRLYGAAILLAPLVGVGLVQSIAGRNLGVGLQPAFVPLSILFALFALRWMSHASLEWDADGVAFALALLWAGWSLGFTWRTDDIGLVGEVAWRKSLKQWITLLFFAATAVAPVWMVARSSRPRKLLEDLERFSTLALLLTASYALFELVLWRFSPWAANHLSQIFATNPSIAAGSEELYLGHAFTGLGRARGFFPEPLHLGSYLVATVPLAASMAVGRRGWSRLWRAAAAVLGTVALLATYSRGAYLGFAFVVAGVFVAAWRGRLPGLSRRGLLWGAGSGLVGLVVLFSLVAGVSPWSVMGLLWSRAMQSLAHHDMSNLTRFYAWGAAWKIFLAHPLSGVGWGAFGFHYYTVAGDAGSGAHFGWPMANSVPLLVLAELGSVGLLLSARAVWPALRRAFGASVHDASDPIWGAMCTILALSAGGVLVQTLTFSQWNLPHIWILLGCSAAAARAQREVV